MMRPIARKAFSDKRVWNVVKGMVYNLNDARAITASVEDAEGLCEKERQKYRDDFLSLSFKVRKLLRSIGTTLKEVEGLMLEELGK